VFAELSPELALVLKTVQQFPFQKHVHDFPFRERGQDKMKARTTITCSANQRSALRSASPVQRSRVLPIVIGRRPSVAFSSRSFRRSRWVVVTCLTAPSSASITFNDTSNPY
jgi:hypothetical protein